MRKLVLGWLINGLAVAVAGYLFPDYIRYTDVASVALFAITLGLLNAFLRPLLKVFLLPLAILTLGLAFFVVNVGLFWLAGALVPGVEIRGLIGALLGSLTLTAVNIVASWLLRSS